MERVFGEVFDLEAGAGPASTIRLVDGALKLAWQHSSTTAEFLGDFHALGAAAGGLDYNEARHSIVYLVNELLENALKFRAPGDIEITSRLAGNTFELVVTNMIPEATAERFGVLLGELTAGDPGELLIERIEANAADPGSSGSGLGLLTLMNDYGVRLGWRFDRQPAGAVRLRTCAALDLA